VRSNPWAAADWVLPSRTLTAQAARATVLNAATLLAAYGSTRRICRVSRRVSERLPGANAACEVIALAARQKFNNPHRENLFGLGPDPNLK
jgi:hypothetical protein